MTIGRIPSVEGGIQPTIFDAKADLLTATAADTPARLAVGNNGEQLLADSGATTGLRWQGDFAAGKNKIINGDFAINQRAFSSQTTNGVYLFDRWLSAFSGTSGTITYSAQTFTAGTAPVTGYESTNFLQIVTSGVTASGSSAQIQVQHRIEDVRTFANQTVTVSFWAKAASGTPKIGLRWEQNFGSGGSTAVVTDFGTIQQISTSWTRYSFTGTVSSISGKTIGSSSYLGLRMYVGAGSTYFSGNLGLEDNTFQFWGVQVEAGSVATAFQTATGTLAGELAACQRYYQEIADVAQTVGYGTRYNSTTVYYSVPCPVQMRTTTPTASYSGTVYNEGTSGNGTLSSPTVQRANPGFICVLATCSVTPTSGVAYIITYGKHTFSAEL
jgi:hypothetical protein